MAKIKQNPFSFYDFLGYFFPGSFLLLLIYFCSSVDKYSLDSFLNFLKDNFYSNNQFWCSLDDTLILIIISYILGHLLAFISSITIEPFSNLLFGYPSKYLMNLQNSRIRDFNAFKFYSFCFLSIALLPFSIFTLILKEVAYFIHKNNPSYYFPKRIDDNLRIIIFHKINKLIDYLNIECKNSENITVNKIKDNNCNERKFIKFLKNPINFFFKQKNVINTENSNISKYNLTNTDYYRIISSYVYENDKKHAEKMDNYVTLYGFLRSLCLIFTFFSWFFIIKGININGQFIPDLFWWILFSLLASFFFFLGFIKFYRRYTLEGLLAIITDQKIIEPKNSSTNKIITKKDYFSKLLKILLKLDN